MVPLLFGVDDPFGVELFGSVVLFGADPFGVTLLGLVESCVVPFDMDEPLFMDEPFMSEPVCALFFLCLWCFDVWVVVELPVVEPLVSVDEPC